MEIEKLSTYFDSEKIFKIIKAKENIYVEFISADMFIILN